MVQILKLMGIDDSDEVNFVRGYGKEGEPEFHIDGIMPLLRHLHHKDFQVNTIVLGGKNSIDIKIDKPQLLFNSICDADSNQKSLKVAVNIASTLHDIPIVNHPKNVMKTTRDGIYALYKEMEGVVVPKTLRVSPRYLTEIEKSIDEKKIALPFIFRPAGGQAGIGMVLIRSKEDLPKLEQFAFDDRAYYMIEYVDFMSPDELYRKYRYFVIGGKVYPGHLIISEHWDIHKDSKYHAKIQRAYSKTEQEERAFLKKWDRKVSPVFREMYERLGLDYFGIDCGFDKQGNIVIFEINACMNIFSPEKDLSYYTDKYRKMIKDAAIEMFYTKLTETQKAAK